MQTISHFLMTGAVNHQLRQIAVETSIKDYYTSNEADIKHRLQHSIQAANVQIYQRGHEEEEVWGMGTTIVAAVIQGDQLVVAHVGDSRAYLLRQGQLKQLTTDHSLVQDLSSRGLRRLRGRKKVEG